jgi:hypothetical protein
MNDILIVLCGLCNVLIIADWWRRVFKSRWVAKRVKRMYASARAIGHPLHIGAIMDIAEDLGVNLDADN